jgi:hypothetical protein
LRTQLCQHQRSSHLPLRVRGMGVGKEFHVRPNGGLSRERASGCVGSFYGRPVW